MVGENHLRRRSSRGKTGGRDPVRRTSCRNSPGSWRDRHRLARPLRPLLSARVARPAGIFHRHSASSAAIALSIGWAREADRFFRASARTGYSTFRRHARAILREVCATEGRLLVDEPDGDRLFDQLWVPRWASRSEAAATIRADSGKCSATIACSSRSVLSSQPYFDALADERIDERCNLYDFESRLRRVGVFLRGPYGEAGPASRISAIMAGTPRRRGTSRSSKRSEQWIVLFAALVLKCPSLSMRGGPAAAGLQAAARRRGECGCSSATIVRALGECGRLHVPGRLIARRRTESASSRWIARRRARSSAGGTSSPVAPCSINARVPRRSWRPPEPRPTSLRSRRAAGLRHAGIQHQHVGGPQQPEGVLRGGTRPVKTHAILDL